MGQSSDELRHEIDQRRHEAERKINDLQGQIQGTADELKAQAQGTITDVREQVEGTVSDVRDQVQGTVEDTIQTVKENFHLEEFVQERPLVSLGAALIGGFVIGGLLNDSGNGGSTSSHASGTSSSHSSNSSGGLGHSLRGALKSSGLEDTINSAAAAMMGSITEQVKQTMDQNMPGFGERMKTAQQTEGSISDKSRQVL